MSRFFNAAYKDLIPYTPGEQPKEGEYIKLNTNESPFAPPEDVTEAAKNARTLNLYSDPLCADLISKIAEIYDVENDCVIVNNGSDESLLFAFEAFGGESGAAFADLTYGFYTVFADFTHTPYVEIPLKDDFTIDPDDYTGLGKTIFIANPNAPTGLVLPLSEIEKIVKSNPDNIVVVDEAYVDFGGESAIPLTKKYDNVLVTRTFSKSRSMAGARLGFAIGNRELIRDLNTIRFSTNPYNVDSMTLAAGLAMLNHEDITKKNCREIAETREYTKKRLEEMGFSVTDSRTNFVFAVHPELEGEEFYKELKERKILVRHFGNERICQYNRITVGTREQMDRFLEVTKEILLEKQK